MVTTWGLFYPQHLHLCNGWCVFCFSSRARLWSGSGIFRLVLQRQSQASPHALIHPHVGALVHAISQEAWGLSHPSFASQRHQPAYAAVRPIAQPRDHPRECQRITRLDWVRIQPTQQPHKLQVT